MSSHRRTLAAAVRLRRGVGVALPHLHRRRLVSGRARRDRGGGGGRHGDPMAAAARARLPGRRPGRAAALPEPGVRPQQVTAAPAADARLRPTTRAPGRPGVRRRRQVRSPGPRAGPDGAARGRRHRDRGPAHRLDGGPAWQRRAGGPAAAAAVHRAVHAQRRPRLPRHHGGVLRRHRRVSRPAQQRGQGPHPRVGIPGPVRPQRARHEGPGGGRAKGRLRLGDRRPDPAPGRPGAARHPAIRRRAAGDRRARRRRRRAAAGRGASGSPGWTRSSRSSSRQS